jgi:hypothetical protein
MFAALGLLLVGYGLYSNPAIYQRSLGIDINLYWGWVLLVLGAAMLFFAWRSRAGASSTGHR